MVRDVRHVRRQLIPVWELVRGDVLLHNSVSHGVYVVGSTPFQGSGQPCCGLRDAPLHIRRCELQYPRAVGWCDVLGSP